MSVPNASIHFRISARERIEQLVDPGSFEEMFDDIEPADPLKFVDKKAYKDRLKSEQRKIRRKRRGGLRQGVHQGPADHDRGRWTRRS